MSDFVFVVGIAGIAALLTFLGALAGGRLDVSPGVVNGALQFAAGIKIAIIALSLMPQAVRGIEPLVAVIVFCCGGALFVLFEYGLTRWLAVDPALDASAPPLGVYIAVLGDMVIDGLVIGIASGLSLKTGLILALGLGVEMGILAFVTTAATRKQHVTQQRPPLALMFCAIVITGAMLGYLLLRNQQEQIKLTLVALSAGFLITAVTQGLIPAAIAKDKLGLSGLMFVAGLFFYGILTAVSA